jgi:hypothetical protein
VLAEHPAVGDLLLLWEPTVKASPEQFTIHPPGPAWRAAHDRLWPLMRRIAVNMADDAENLADDLVREALVKL